MVFRKTITSFLLLSTLFLFSMLFSLSMKSVYAQDQQVTISFFHSDSCPHCQKEKTFLENYDTLHESVNVSMYEISKNKQNALLFAKVGKTLNASTSNVPFTVVGKRYLVGYSSADTTGQMIQNMVTEAQNDPEYQDIVSYLQEGGSTSSPAMNTNDTGVAIPESILIPFIGSISIKQLSLPVLTLIIAALDGFNPCAMWVLIFLVSMLLGMKDKKRMWILGGTFIAVSSLVYLLFLTAWLNLFLFIGFIREVQLLIGLFALGAGGYYIYDWYINKSGLCKVDISGSKKKILDRIKKVTHEQKLAVALVGIVVLAFTVNLVEALCSAGLPAIYTSVLVGSQLPLWQYYGFLLLYIFIFMLDDLLIFVIAMTTLKVAGLEGKYARHARLLGGIIMFIIGFAMLFNPSLLTFS